MEPAASLFLTFGIACLLLSWIVLLIVSSKEDFAWGLCSVFLPPLSYLYCLAEFDKTKGVLGLAATGWILIALALA
jgi:hypothetical protein